MNELELIKEFLSSIVFSRSDFKSKNSYIQSLKGGGDPYQSLPHINFSIFNENTMIAESEVLLGLKRLDNHTRVKYLESLFLQEERGFTKKNDRRLYLIEEVRERYLKVFSGEFSISEVFNYRMDRIKFLRDICQKDSIRWSPFFLNPLFVDSLDELDFIVHEERFFGCSISEIIDFYVTSKLILASLPILIHDPTSYLGGFKDRKLFKTLSKNKGFISNLIKQDPIVLTTLYRLNYSMHSSSTTDIICSSLRNGYLNIYEKDRDEKLDLKILNLRFRLLFTYLLMLEPSLKESRNAGFLFEILPFTNWPLEIIDQFTENCSAYRDWKKIKELF